MHELGHNQAEMNHLVKALSHDMNANFMVLEHSFKQLKRRVDDNALPNLAEGAAHVEACLRQSKRLLDDLVILAKTGSVQMEPDRVEVWRSVQEVIFEQQELFEGRGIKVDVQTDLPAVWCNENRLKQLITNLIRNAAKHGCDQSDPRITISRCQAVGDDERVSVEVHDNGPGIQPAAREEIFLPGRRLSNAVGEGTGLGLAIVRRIVEHYAGSVYVDPQCAEGTAFVVSLPKAPDDL